MKSLNDLFAPRESSRFGFNIGKFSVSSDTDVFSIIDKARADGLEMMIARVATHLHHQIHNIERKNGLLCDSLVIHELRLPLARPVDPINHTSSTAFEVVEASATDRVQVETIARQVFVDYDGHFHADSRLNRGAAIEVYADWSGSLTSSIYDGSTFLVKRDATICAFGSVKKTSTNVADCPLFFVAPEFQGLGLFSLLLGKAISWAASNDCEVIEYSTQITNIAAQRGVAKQGFRLSRSYYTFHCWI